MQQMLILLQITDHFPINSFVLQWAMQNNEDFGCDAPVIQVGNVTFKDELQGANWANLVLMLTIQTFKQIYAAKLETDSMNESGHLGR